MVGLYQVLFIKPQETPIYLVLSYILTQSLFVVIPRIRQEEPIVNYNLVINELNVLIGCIRIYLVHLSCVCISVHILTRILQFLIEINMDKVSSLSG